jgi:hypothetical protein
MTLDSLAPCSSLGIRLQESYLDQESSMKILRPEDVKVFPEIRELSPEELKEAYALARAAFTAEDLQRYTEEEEGVPMEEVLKEMEEDQRKFDQKAL